MPRRTSGGRVGRTTVRVARPAPESSAVAAPANANIASIYTSEATESALSESIRSMTIDIAALTADIPLANRPPKRKPIKPFRFFDLPSELRLKVYHYHFAHVDSVLDLEYDNYKRIHLKLALFRTCRQIYREASHLFYSTHAVRIFPISGKFLKAKKPLLARMKPRSRAMLTTLQLRLGTGWGAPPRGWVVNPALGLKDCVNVRRVKVFVDCDPGNPIFKGFRLSDGFYEKFTKNLLDAILSGLPWCQVVEFDAEPSVKKYGDMMKGLIEVAEAHGRHLAWGPNKGWDDGEEAPDPEPIINHGRIGVPMLNTDIMIDPEEHARRQQHGYTLVIAQ